MTSNLEFSPAEKQQAKELAETWYRCQGMTKARRLARNVIIGRRLVKDIELAAHQGSVTMLASTMRDLVQFMFPDPEEAS